MKKVILILFTLAVSITACLASGRSADRSMVIDKFEYSAQVHADNTWDVSETVHVDFKSPRHGIFQYIEQKYNVVQGGMERHCFTPVSGIEVVSHDSKTTYLQNDRFAVIRIGDSSTELEGKVVYCIKYKLHFSDDGFKEEDLLYTSLLGVRWECNIKEFNYNISFDEPLPANFPKTLHIYSGKLGNEDNSLKVSCNFIGTNIISGSAADIEPFNGITLFSRMPEGYWKNPSHPELLKVMWVAEWVKSSFFSLPSLLVFCVFVLFIVIVVRLLLLNRGGEKPTPIMTFKAPDGISSAEVGYIIDLSVDVKDMTSLIIWWASQGYLSIEEAAKENAKSKTVKSDEPEVILHKIKDLPKDAPAYQQKFWKVFFSKKDSIAISKIGKKYKQIESAQEALRDKYRGEKSLQDFNWSLFGYLFGFMFLSVFTILVNCWSRDAYEMLFVWVAAVVIGVFYRLSSSDSKYVDSWKDKLIHYGILFGLFCLSVVVVYFVIEDGSPRCPNIVLYGITVMTWILIMISPNMQHDTLCRIDLMSQLLGFREFINTAEKSKLNALVDENPNYFYEVLPYAIVFGLSDKWCKQFEEIDFDPPSWYNAGYVHIAGEIVMAGAVVADLLTDRFDKVISSHVQTSSISPSSGSSGSRRSSGGHSGGGGGGGGGGSW